MKRCRNWLNEVVTLSQNIEHRDCDIALHPGNPIAIGVVYSLFRFEFFNNIQFHG